MVRRRAHADVRLVLLGPARRFAVEVYKCAADYKGGCNNMGVAYMAGRGVAADPVRAVDLYRKACDAGDMVGCSNLA